MSAEGWRTVVALAPIVLAWCIAIACWVATRRAHWQVRP